VPAATRPSTQAPPAGPIQRTLGSVQQLLGNVTGNVKPPVGQLQSLLKYLLK
jgi:hypothetical protein